MTNKNKELAIFNWQNSDNMHPLTCGNCGRKMYPATLDGDIILKCSCGCRQEDVPEIVYKRFRWEYLS